jgi:hypothetical protein
MSPEILEQRAQRLVDRLRARGVMVWIGGAGSVFMTPLSKVPANDRAFIAAHPEAITEALAPDGDERRALARVAARLAVHAARRPRSPRRRRALSSGERRWRTRYVGGASTSRSA